VDQVLGRLDAIQDLMKRAMVKGTDYGVIPGTGSKPTLLKPGAEKMCLMFRFAPAYQTAKTWHDDGHLTVESTCKIMSLSGEFLGEASAMCSTRESKYAYRKGERVCPECGKSAIVKGSAQYGGGFVCWKKKEGCGHKFDEADTRITSQAVGRTKNEDVADVYNTVLRISEKRAYVGAVRLVTGSSALFDEEIPAKNEEELPQDNHQEQAPRQAPAPQAATWTAEQQRDLATWDDWLAETRSLQSFNDGLNDWWKIPDKFFRSAVWKRFVKTAAEKYGWRFDDTAKKFAPKEGGTA
jgi:hypothetical protein